MTDRDYYAIAAMQTLLPLTDLTSIIKGTTKNQVKINQMQSFISMDDLKNSIINELKYLPTVCYIIADTMLLVKKQQ